MKTISALLLLPALTTASCFLASMTSEPCWWNSLNFRFRWFKSNRSIAPEPVEEISTEPAEAQSHHSLIVNAARYYAFKNYAAALNNYRRVLVDIPDDMIALSGEAWCLYYLGQEEQAAKDFQALLKADANDSWAQEGLALCSHHHSA